MTTKQPEDPPKCKRGRTGKVETHWVNFQKRSNFYLFMPVNSIYNAGMIVPTYFLVGCHMK